MRKLSRIQHGEFLKRDMTLALVLVGVLVITDVPIPINDVSARAFVSLSGQVLDATTSAPLPNVTLTIAGTNQTVRTDTAGNFSFFFPPLGQQTLFMDARTTTTPGSWPIFPMPINISMGQNTLPSPIWLVALDTANGTRLTTSNFNSTTGQVLQTLIVTSPTAPGVIITIPQGTFMRNPWSALTLGDILSITRVPSNRPPQPLPNNSVAGMMVIAQPGGILFSDASNNPVKVPMQFPNVSNEFNNGSQVSLFSAMGGQFGTMVNGGPMTVQGGNILPNTGTGISHFSCKWTPPSPPIASTNTGNNPQNLIDPSKICPLPIGSTANPLNGNLTLEHSIAAHRAMDRSQPLQLVYNSSTAYPHPVITNQAYLSANAPNPLATSVALTVNGTPQGNPVFWQGTTQLNRQAMTFDATNLSTGSYPYRLNITDHYQATTSAAIVSDNVLVHNQITSAFGAGWGLAGFERLQLDTQGNAFISNGTGNISLFKFNVKAIGSSGFPIQDIIFSTLPRYLNVFLGNGDGTFQSQRIFDVGFQPLSIAIGHFDQDRFEDLAVGRDNSVAIFQGNGDGTFRSPATFSTGAPVGKIAVGHFNTDVFDDLAVLHPGANNLAILLGNGNGTFQPPQIFSMGNAPSSVAIGHFNGDGFEDLVVTNRMSNNISILLGIGNGTFQNQTIFSVGTLPRSAVIGHFDGDVFADIAIVNAPVSLPGNVSILLGNGDGTFRFHTTASVRFDPASIVNGDFNSDAFEDLAVVNFNGGVSILLGNGDGTFQPQVIVPVGSFSLYIAKAYFNNDAIEDLAVTNGYVYDDTISILLGNGDGAFQPQKKMSAGRSPANIAIGNFNNDFIIPGFNPPPGDFSTLVRNPNGTFTRTLRDGAKIDFNAQGFQTRIIDRNGNITAYSYNTNGTLRLITDPAGFTYTFNYDATGHLQTIVDSANRITTFTIDGRGDLIDIRDPDGSRATFTYDSLQVTGQDHLMATRVSPRAYDPLEPLPPPQFVTSYTYNFAGQLAQTDHPGPNSTTITWRLLPSQANALVDPASGIGNSVSNPAPLVLAQNVAAQLTDPNGRLTRMVVDKFGAETQLTDPLGRVTTMQRDNFGNATKITKPNGAVTTMLYDLKGNLLQWNEEGTNGPGSDDHTTFLTYEPLHNQVATILDPNGNTNSAGVTTKIDYDVFGNATRITDAANTITELIYDQPPLPNVRGLLTSITSARNLPEQTTTTFFYNPNNANLRTLTDSLNRITSFTYDSVGNVRTATAEGNDNNPATDQITTFGYDVMNNLRSVTDANNQTTTYDYDSQGNLTKVTDAKVPAGITRYFYNERDQVSQVTDPLNAAVIFNYDPKGNLRTHIDRKNKIFTFSHDAADRLTQKEFPAAPSTPGNTIVTFGYDNNQNGNLLDDNDNLAKVISPDAVLTYVYNGFDQLSTAATTGSPYQPDATLSYTYDKNDNRLTMTARDNPTNTTIASLSYTPDNLNRLDRFTNVLTGQVVDFTDDALSRRKQIDFPNQMRTNITYNTASEINTIAHTHVPTNRLISQFTYVPDPVGNRDRLTETRPSFGITAGLNDFTNDLLNRLTQATHPTIPVENYQYDAVGNRNPATWLYNVANQLRDDGSFTYLYDANGNAQSKTPRGGGMATTYTYSPENQLSNYQSSVLSSQYKYDGLGRRIQKLVMPGGSPTTTRYIYDQEDILLEYDGNNVLQARYMHGPGIDDPMLLERGSQRYHYHTDGLGSITEITDSTGTVVRSYLYDSFGNLRNQTGGLLNPYTYTGREYDSESGLMHYRFRTYDPNIGRFLQEDPLGYVDGMNLFSYTKNNPVNFTDPFGLQLGHPRPPIIFPPPLLPPILPPITPIQPPPVCSSNGSPEIEDECHLIDKGPTVCIYRCEASGKIVTRGPGVPGEPSTCAPLIKHRVKLF